jgi:hypothetical protein
MTRHVEVDAQRPPHVARVDSVLDGLRGRAAAETTQDVVDEHRATSHRAKPAFDEFVEFGQTHGPILGGRFQRVMAHPYRIGDVFDGVPRPSGGGAVRGPR